MEQLILDEIKQLRSAVSKLIGTSDQPLKKQFSKSALDRAAIQFQKLGIERGEWVEGYNISKYIKKAPYDAGNFIIREFGFISIEVKSSISTKRIWPR